MLGLAMLGWLASTAAMAENDVVDRMPSSTRLIVGIHLQRMMEAPLAKQHSERWKVIFADWSMAFSNLGLDPQQVERIWIAAGEGYPRGTVILLTGKIDAGKFEGKMQQHIRERRFSVRPFREENRACFSMDTPVGMNPIPGMPPTLFVTARNDCVVVAFDQETLTFMLQPTQPAKNGISEARPALERPADMVGTCVPTEPLTGANAIFADVARINLELIVQDGVGAKLEFRTTAPESLHGRMLSGLNQARQLFPPLAAQQGLDGRLIQLINEFLVSGKMDKQNECVILKLDLTAEAFGRALKK